MKLEIHVTFNGQCEAAFHFYQHYFGGKIVTMLTWGNSPMAKDVPTEWHSKICHATLTFGENVLAGADATAARYEPPRGFHILLNIQEQAEAERVFNELSHRGTVKMPLQQTFWAARYGILTDQFGIPWEINCPSAA